MNITKNHSRNKVLLYVVGILSIFALGSFFVAWKFYDVGYSVCTQDNNSALAEAQFKSQIVPTSTPIPTPTTSLASYTWYKVAMTSTSAKPNSELGGMIAVFGRALYHVQFSTDSSDSDNYNTKLSALAKVIPKLWVGYKVSEIPKPFDRSNGIFYIPSTKILTPGTYFDGTTELVVSTVPEQEYQYLANRKYCHVDSDCSIRESYCNIGAYNQYDQFPVSGYGCGGGSPYPDIGVETDVIARSLGCLPKYGYNYASCIKNQCVAQGMTIKCAENTPIFNQQ